MHISINDNTGNVIGGLETTQETLWIDLLLFASQQWEAQAAQRQGDALEAILAGHVSDAA